MIKPKFFLRYKQTGLSLVELMVSVAVGLILMVIIVQITVGSKDVYRSNDNQSRLQENGRYIIDEMSRDIRMAGYLGCAKNSKMNMQVKASLDDWKKFSEGIRGYESVSTGLGLDAAEVMAGTDFIRVQRASESNANQSGNLEADNANVQITSNPEEFVAGDTLLISDCASTDVFCANNVSNSGGKVTITHSTSCNADSKLSKLYGATSQIMRLSSNVYYIGTGAGTASGVTPCPANTLCRKSLKGGVLVIEPLIDDVQDLQLEYGEDTDGDSAANRVVTAPSVIAWGNVVSVHLNILLRSHDANVVTSPQTYTFNSASATTPTDRRLRRVFSSTVALRNRTL